MKFTIRDLFLLTLIVGLSIGWSISYFRSREAYRSLQSDHKELRDLTITLRDEFRDAKAEYDLVNQDLNRALMARNKTGLPVRQGYVINWKLSEVPIPP